MKITNNLLHNQSYVLWNREKSKIFTSFLHKSITLKYTEVLKNMIKFSYLIVGFWLLMYIVYFFWFLYTQDIFQSIILIWMSGVLFIVFFKVVSKKVKHEDDNVNIRIRQRSTWNDGEMNYYKVPKFKVWILNNNIEWFMKMKWFINFFLFLIVSIGIIFLTMSHYHIQWGDLLPIFIVWVGLCIYYAFWNILHKVSIIYTIVFLITLPFISLFCILLYFNFRLKWIPNFHILKKQIYAKAMSRFVIRAFSSYSDYMIEITKKK